MVWRTAVQQSHRVKVVNIATYLDVHPHIVVDTNHSYRCYNSPDKTIDNGYSLAATPTARPGMNLQ